MNTVKVAGKILFPVTLLLLLCGQSAHAQTVSPSSTTSGASSIDALQRQIQMLLGEIQNLKSKVTVLEARPTNSPQPVPPPSPQSSFTPLSSDVIRDETGPPLAPPVLTRSLSRGARGDDVRALQEFLAQDPSIYPEGLTTGYFGPGTQNAVSRWQKKYGIDTTGTVGPRTIAKFRDLGQGQADQTQTGTEQPSVPFIADIHVSPPVPPTNPTPRDSSLLGQLCPLIPTVETCPAGQERTVSYQSAQCGLYYSCVARGTHTATPFPYVFTNGKTVNSWDEASAYCWANGPGSGRGIAAECEAKFGVIYPNQTATTTTAIGIAPAGQRNQVWNALSLQSWIRTDADVSRIEQLKQACQNTPVGSNVWMTSAGNPASADFGMPSFDKCRLAASCTTGQYFDGARCVASGTGSWGGGSGSGSNWAWHTWNFRDGGTTQSNILNRTDKEYLDFIAGVDAQCRTTITRNQFAWKSGAGNDAASNWQNFGIPDCSGIATINSSSTIVSPPTPPSGQKEQVWNSQGLKSWIRSDADPVRIAQVQQACSAVSQGANVWTAGAGTYTSADFGMPDPDKCRRAVACTASQYFDGATCSSGSPYGSTASSSYQTSGSCPSGYYWTGSTCMSSSGSGSPCGAGLYWNGSACVSSSSGGGSCPGGQYWFTPMGGGTGYCTSTGTSCSSGQYWNGSMCVSSGSSSGSCPSGYYWNGSSCMSSGSSGSGMTCSGGQYWNGTSCVNSPSGGYSSDPATACAQGGGTWNGSYCNMPGMTSGCTSGQYWNGSACVSSSGSSSCSGGQYWNGTSCVSSTSGSATTCSSGQYWNGSACVSSTTCSSGQYWNGTSCMSSMSPMPMPMPSPMPTPPPSSSLSPSSLTAQAAQIQSILQSLQAILQKL